jgi:hypothetical protein
MTVLVFCPGKDPKSESMTLEKCGVMENERDRQLGDLLAGPRLAVTYSVAVVTFCLWPLVPTHHVRI